MSNDIQCPYCGKEQEICHDDGYGYEEDRMWEQDCRSCGKTFGFKTTIMFSYKAYATPCKETNKHVWKRTKTFPKEFSRMFCTVCEEERPMTAEEREAEGIGTPKDYFEQLDRERQKG